MLKNRVSDGVCHFQLVLLDLIYTESAVCGFIGKGIKLFKFNSLIQLTWLLEQHSRPAVPLGSEFISTTGLICEHFSTSKQWEMRDLFILKRGCRSLTNKTTGIFLSLYSNVHRSHYHMYIKFIFQFIFHVIILNIIQPKRVDCIINVSHDSYILW